MNDSSPQHTTPALTPQAFSPYTAIPQVEQLLEEHLGDRAKLLMSDQHRETFAKLAPWFTLVFMPFHFAAVVLLFGVTALASLVGHFSWGSALLSGAVLVCDAIALPGLFKRTRQGWTFMVYAQTISLLSELLSTSMFGVLVGVLVMWILFQVKYKYT